MKHFLKQHLQESLVASALLFFALIVGYFIWGIMTISLDVNRAVNTTATDGASVTFDLKDAMNLNLKGLMQE